MGGKTGRSGEGCGFRGAVGRLVDRAGETELQGRRCWLGLRLETEADIAGQIGLQMGQQMTDGGMGLVVFMGDRRLMLMVVFVSLGHRYLGMFMLAMDGRHSPAEAGRKEGPDRDDQEQLRHE